MAANTPQNYIVRGQAPMDAKMTFDSKDHFFKLKTENPKYAFDFYKGMIVYFKKEEQFYIWEQPFSRFYDHHDKIDNFDFVYPTGSVYEDYDYSGRSFNLIEYTINKENLGPWDIIDQDDKMIIIYVTEGVIGDPFQKQQILDEWPTAKKIVFVDGIVKGIKLFGQQIVLNQEISLNDWDVMTYDIWNPAPNFEQLAKMLVILEGEVIDYSIYNNKILGNSFKEVRIIHESVSAKIQNSIYFLKKEEGGFDILVRDEFNIERRLSDYMQSFIGDSGTLQAVTDNGNETNNSITVQKAKFASVESKKMISISPNSYENKPISYVSIIGYDVLPKLNGVEVPELPNYTTKYTAFGSNLMTEFTGDTDYRPGHPAHDSITVIGSNMGKNIVDGTNIVLIGMTQFYLNDIPLFDTVVSVGKGNTNNRPPYNTPNRQVLAESNGYNLREMVTGVAQLGGEHWYGDIHSSTVLGTSTRNWKYIFNSVILGFENMTNELEAIDDRILDSDVLIGNGLVKNLQRHSRTHNLLIGNQYGRGNSAAGGGFDQNYIPLIEGNFKYPFLRVNGRFHINDAHSQVPLISSGSDGSMTLFNTDDYTGPLRSRTFIIGRKVFNQNIHSHPQSSFGGFIGAGVNNFPILATDSSTPDEINSITVFGQRNGVFHKEGYNIQSFGTVGHTQFSNPLKDIANFGILGVGFGMTAPETPTTPTSGVLMKYNEKTASLGNNYIRFVYNSVLLGMNNAGIRLAADSILLGNNNGFAGDGPNFYNKNLDHSIVIGSSMLNDGTIGNFANNWNLCIGQGGREFIGGFYGTGQRYTRLHGKIQLDERIRLQPYTKTQMDALTSLEIGDTALRTDNNPGVYTWDGTKWISAPIPAATDTAIGGVKVWFGTQAQYNAINPKVADVIYYIQE